MEWKHKCSLDWLRKRQEYLTASDIRSLLPVTKTGRPRKVTETDYLKVKAAKLKELTEEDCWSYGAAARGHILEPYAIEEFNRTHADGRTFYHWDDAIVDDGNGGIAFSPDGMDVPMPSDADYTSVAALASSIVEVKSYSPERHLVTAHTPKDQIEERWQIAHAMAVCANIRDAWLLLYNPSMKARLYGIHYTRKDLEQEIGTVFKVALDWALFNISGPMTIPFDLSSAGTRSEADIVRELEERQQLNPV